MGIFDFFKGGKDKPEKDNSKKKKEKRDTNGNSNDTILRVLSRKIEDKKGEDGEWTTYYNNKPFDGIEYDVYENGQLKYEYPYKNGKSEGLGREWFENGQLETERNCKNGLHEGPFKYFYENGKLRYEGKITLGENDGVHKDWDENGQLIKETTYKDGELIKEEDYNSDETNSDELEWSEYWSNEEDKFILDVKQIFKDYQEEILNFKSNHNLNEDNWGDYGYRFLFGDLQEDCGDKINSLMDDIIHGFDSDDEDLDSGCISDMEGICMSELMNLFDL